MSWKVAVVGLSWGGLRALEVVLPALPRDLAFTVVIAQHRGKENPDDRIIEHLQALTPLPIAEAEDKAPLDPGRIYLAPADYHVLVGRKGIELSVEEPVWHARPSIDVLFESAAYSFGREAIGVLLTGASRDGAVGLKLLRDSGAMTAVQNPDTAEMSVMPRAALALEPEHPLLNLEEIGPFLARASAGRDLAHG